MEGYIRMANEYLVAQNQELIQVLKNAWQRKLDRIARLKKEIFEIKLELLELGVELPEGE